MNHFSDLGSIDQTRCFEKHLEILEGLQNSHFAVQEESLTCERNLMFKSNIPHLLQIVDEDHVKGLVPAAVQQEVEAIHL